MQLLRLQALVSTIILKCYYRIDLRSTAPIVSRISLSNHLMTMPSEISTQKSQSGLDRSLSPKSIKIGKIIPNPTQIYNSY